MTPKGGERFGLTVANYDHCLHEVYGLVHQ